LATGIEMAADLVSMKDAELRKIRKDIEDLKFKIEKRRETLETKGSTVIARKKEQARLEGIDEQIVSKTAAIDKTIDYYKMEIQTAERKLEDEKSTVEKKLEGELETLQLKYEAEKKKLEDKYEVQKKKLDDKFSTYRIYCMTQVSSQEQKRAVITEPLEKKKETLQQLLDKTEDDDSYLVGYKIDLRRLEAEEKKAVESLQNEIRYDEEKREKRRRQAELDAKLELERHQQLEREKALKERELVNQQKQQEKAADEERWLRQKEERKKQLEEEEFKQRQKETATNLYQTFIKTFYPLLKEKSKAIYKFLKEDVEALHKEVWTKETLEDCEKFLSQFEEDYDTIKDFEENKLQSLSSEQQLSFSNKSIQQQIKFIKVQDKLRDKKETPKSRTTIPLSSLSSLQRKTMN